MARQRRTKKAGILGSGPMDHEMVAGACNHPNLLVCLSAFHWFVLLPSDVAAAVTVDKSIEKGSFYAQADPRLNHFNDSRPCGNVGAVRLAQRSRTTQE